MGIPNEIYDYMIANGMDFMSNQDMMRASLSGGSHDRRYHVCCRVGSHEVFCLRRGDRDPRDPAEYEIFVSADRRYRDGMCRGWRYRGRGEEEESEG